MVNAGSNIWWLAIWPAKTSATPAARYCCWATMQRSLQPWCWPPGSLHGLWQEYQHDGVLGGGRKAARRRLFSQQSAERGHFKHQYPHWQKLEWDSIGGLVRQGHTADAGIVDRIYAVYSGQTSITNIINGLKRGSRKKSLWVPTILQFVK